jgi:hypothetical protein
MRMMAAIDQLSGPSGCGTFGDPLVARIAEFLMSIGLRIAAGAAQEDTFLPGIHIQNGILTIDEPKLLYPGDLLHEAGHLAMLTPSQRDCTDGRMADDGGLEMAALAWSYAAALHLDIPPQVVFHQAGYRGGSIALLENFGAGRYIGVPLLEWAGLTVMEKRAQALGAQPYPAMLHWLRAE